MILCRCDLVMHGTMEKGRCTKGQQYLVARNLFETEREPVRALKGIQAFEWHAFACRMISLWEGVWA